MRGESSASAAADRERWQVDTLREARSSWILVGLGVLAMACLVVGKIGLRSTDVITDAGKVTTSTAMHVYRSFRDAGLALGLVISWAFGIHSLRYGNRRQALPLLTWGLALVALGVVTPLYGRAAILRILSDLDQGHAESLPRLARALERTDLPPDKRARLEQLYADEAHIIGTESDRAPSGTAVRFRNLHEVLKPQPRALAWTAALWSAVWIMSVTIGLLWPSRSRLPQLLGGGLPPNRAIDPPARGARDQ